MKRSRLYNWGTRVVSRELVNYQNVCSYVCHHHYISQFGTGCQHASFHLLKIIHVVSKCQLSKLSQMKGEIVFFICENENGQFLSMKLYFLSPAFTDNSLIHQMNELEITLWVYLKKKIVIYSSCSLRFFLISHNCLQI